MNDLLKYIALKPVKDMASGALRCLTLAAVVVATTFAAGAALTFNNVPGGYEVIEETPAASTGLERVYVVWNTGRSQAQYRAASASATVRWYRFSNLGGGFAEEIPSYRNGDISYINLTEEDMGYIVEEGTTRSCYWVVNYSNHMAHLTQIEIAPDQSECDRVTLTVGEDAAPRIAYYTINGMQQTLSRDLKLTYNSLEYSEEQQQYVPTVVEKTLESASGNIHTDQPLCETYFTLNGDRFLERWGMEQQAVSPSMAPIAIAVTTSAEESERQNDNEQREEGSDAMGGSGPVTILFKAAVTDAVVYKEWQFSRDASFEVIDLRIQETEVEHVFNEQGTTYVRFVAGNDSGSCDYYSDTYTVYIGESRLECPNAFSPGASEGTNDEWKVSYKSIISFECSIFNRWGQLMCHFTDPSKGWDGKYRGKLVPSGVYYYVIRAKGTDGKEYKKSGDINIIKFKNESRTGSSE